MSYVIGVDVWEGSLDIDELTLKQAGISLLIPRMNDINGILHLDTNFQAQWEQSAPFVRFPYYVYSPWYSGKVNFDFMCSSLPEGVKRVAIDVEVVRSGYSPVEYSANVKGLLNLCVGAGLKPVIYSGAWFLPNLSEWPLNYEYWWARYPYSVYPPQSEIISWDALKAKINALPWTPGATPGPCSLWQCTADRYKPDGCAGRAIDVNIWRGTAEELAAWVGETQPAQRWEYEITAWARRQPDPYTGPDPDRMS